jgi:cytochrome P450
MKSGKMHSAHRQVVISFLSDNHLRNFSVKVTEQIEIMLEKWGCSKNARASAPPRAVNAQYDLSMLTLDIIMVTAFGADEKYLSQHIPEKENRLAHGLDTVLKDIVVRTAVPLYQYIPTPLQMHINSLITEANQLQEDLFRDAMKKMEQEPDAKTMLFELLRHRKKGEADSDGLTDKEIANELQTVRGAGKLLRDILLREFLMQLTIE